MGVTTSKVRDVKVDGTPVIAEKNARILPIDPRSPNPEIVRTPIQIEKTPDQNPRKFLWLKSQDDPLPKMNVVDEMPPGEPEQKTKNREYEITDSENASKKSL